MAVYRQAAERMARAAALCPAGNPDRSVLAKHCGEIHGRVVYLESLQGDEVVPPEHHIGTATLGPHIERQDSDGFQVIGELHLELLGAAFGAKFEVANRFQGPVGDRRQSPQRQ